MDEKQARAEWKSFSKGMARVNRLTTKLCRAVFLAGYRRGYIAAQEQS